MAAAEDPVMRLRSRRGEPVTPGVIDMFSDGDARAWLLDVHAADDYYLEPGGVSIAIHLDPEAVSRLDDRFRAAIRDLNVTAAAAERGLRALAQLLSVLR